MLIEYDQCPILLSILALKFGVKLTRKLLILGL